MGRSLWGGTLALAAAVGGLAAIAAWSLLVAQPGWRQGLAATAWIAATGWTLASWRRSPVGDLAWNGRAWVWSTGGSEAEMTVEPMLDLQRAVLVRLRSGGAGSLPARWLWLEHRARPGAWRALRRAVYSRARPEALPEAGAPPANT